MSFLTVKLHMLGLICTNHDVAWIVVLFVAVNVMNHFIRAKWPPYYGFSNQYMLKNVPIAGCPMVVWFEHLLVPACIQYERLSRRILARAFDRAILLVTLICFQLRAANKALNFWEWSRVVSDASGTVGNGQVMLAAVPLTEVNQSASVNTANANWSSRLLLIKKLLSFLPISIAFESTKRLLGFGVWLGNYTIAISAFRHELIVATYNDAYHYEGRK